MKKMKIYKKVSDVKVTFPELNDLDKELLASYSLKNIKSICKREDLRLSVPKVN